MDDKTKISAKISKNTGNNLIDKYWAIKPNKGGMNVDPT